MCVFKPKTTPLPEILAPALKLTMHFFWNSVVPSFVLDCDVEVEDPCERKQKSSSRVVRRNLFGMQAVSAGPSCSRFASRRGFVDCFATGSFYTFTHSLCLYADVLFSKKQQ